VKISSLPLALWVPLASGVAIGVPGLVALLTLAALGSFRLDWTDTWEVLVGVVAVTVTGELLQMLHPAPAQPPARPARARARTVQS